MSVPNGGTGDHELGAPIWVRSRDFEQFPAGGGYQVSCSCGWRGPVRTTAALGWIAATGHLAAMLGPDAPVPLAPRVATETAPA